VFVEVVRILDRNHPRVFSGPTVVDLTSPTIEGWSAAEEIRR
jgi:hypothetical protein